MQCYFTFDYFIKFLYLMLDLPKKPENQAPFTLVHFRFKMHNFGYGYAYCLHYSSRLLKTLQTPF